MAGIKDLKKKIKSTKQTLKITTAMKLVSGAKLARAQDQVFNARRYVKEMDLIVKEGLSTLDRYSHNLFSNENLENLKDQESLLVVISSNKGLCGNYNSLLTRSLRQFLTKNQSEKFRILNIGKKVRETLLKDFEHGEIFNFAKQDPSQEELFEVAQKLTAQFLDGKIKKVCIAYNYFNNALSFTPEIVQLLPLQVTEEEMRVHRENLGVGHIEDTSFTNLLDELIPHLVFLNLLQCCLEAAAAEHGSRMGAMESASKNCADVIRKLTLKMNKIRQAAITTELIEVISGAEAL